MGTGSASAPRPSPAAHEAVVGPRLVERSDYLVELCRGRRVLHLGCSAHPYTAETLANGAHLHLRLKAVARELWGLDRDRSGLEALRARGCDGLVEGDLEHLAGVSGALPSAPFEVVVAGEIVEHLPNPGLFLRGVRALMGPETLLVLTTINAYCAFRGVYYALRGHGGRREAVHPEHVAYYSHATLRALAVRCGLRPGRALFYDLGREHRATLRPWLRLVNDAAVRCAPQLADGLVLECRRAADGGDGA